MNGTTHYENPTKPDLRVAEVIASAWVSVKERLPEDDDYCLFVQFSQGIIITSYAEQFSDVKKFRKYELKEQYTHWLLLPNPTV
jgi:hypothetical protein